MSTNKLDTIIQSARDSVNIKIMPTNITQIVCLYNSKELYLDPKLCNWSDVMRSNYIESLILGAPIGSVITMFSSKNHYEVIDGYERVYALVHFISSLISEPLVLEDCRFIKDLNGKTYKDLSFKMRLELGRVPLELVEVNKEHKELWDYYLHKVYRPLTLSALVKEAEELEIGY